MIRRIQDHLEAIYAIEGPDVRDFLLDDEGLAALGTERPAREWVLVRQDGEDVDLGVWFHPDDVDTVERLPPHEAVRDALGAWANVVEGVSHFLLLVRRAARDEPVSLLELELQAEVDKFVTAHLVGGPDPRLRGRLFADARLAEGVVGDEAERYLQAGRLADRYCARLERLPHVDALLDELRRFYREPAGARVGRLRRAA